jgi:DNA-binding beta-propeller fold protein YncE
MNKTASRIVPTYNKTERLWKFLHRYRISLLLAAVTIILYALYVNNLTTNPPGFYLDESSMSYNAYQIYLTGRGEFGHPLPLYFPVFQSPPPHDYLGYADPVKIYILSALYFIFPPNLLLSRLLSATAMFLAALLIGRLAMRISHQWSVGVIVALTAILTPWLFEVGRLAFGAALYPLALVLFLSTLYHTYLKERWSLFNSVMLAVTLALLTYTYSIGRLFGPLLALSLLFFATDLNRFKNVIKTWIAYGLTLLPMLVFHIRNPKALTGRFNMEVGIITPGESLWEIAAAFIKNYAENISLRRLLFIGDPNLRHHITDTAPILAATFVLAVAGIFIFAAIYRKDPWWRFILFGLIVSVIPASLTRGPFHMLRLIAFPVFLVILTIPTLIWLFNDARNKPDQEETQPNVVRPSIFRQFIALFTLTWLWFQNIATLAVRRLVLIFLLILTIVQAVLFQIAFQEVGPNRGHWFDDAYPRVFAAALANPTRPIYLIDGYWGEAYIHAYWYAIVQEIDLSNFVHLARDERPPAGSLVLSSEDECSTCEIILKDRYILYKELKPSQSAAVANVNPPSTTETTTPPNANVDTNVPSVSAFEGGQGQFEKPRGIAADAAGNLYVADLGNSRIQKFSPEGEFLKTFGKSGTSEGELREPNGITVDSAGKIYVADALNHRLIRFNADGNFEKQWSGPEPGFYGPRDVAIGPNKQLYVLDQGRSRVVRLDPESENFAEWGQKGTGEGEFDDPTGLAVGDDRVFVTDAANNRIQVFDLDGKFIRQWDVPEWDKYLWHYPDAAFDAQAKRLYITSGWTNEVLVFDADGNRLDSLKPVEEATKLDNPSSLILADAKSGKRLYVLNTGGARVSVFELGKAKPQK